ncbi:MAG: hypothetical protein HC866_14050 [Leptolyngbyaceae cyanobacterium RU_5_1]|nr:hypothetical protein [Leptolyngbyaceae cyanobacterium RU_5_1]
MPYPALPPELPQILSSPAYEAVRCSRLSDSALVEMQNRSDLTRPTPPERFASEFSASQSASSVLRSSSTTVPPSTVPPSTSGSCAALLGNTTAKGYLSTGKRPSVGKQPLNRSASRTDTTQTKSIVVPDGPKRSREPASQGLSLQSQPVSANPQSANTQSGTGQRSLSSYAMSGVSGRLAKMPEAELINSLNQGILFDGLAESYTALSSLSATDLARLGKSKSRRISQAGEQIPGLSPVHPEIHFRPEVVLLCNHQAHRPLRHQAHHRVPHLPVLELPRSNPLPAQGRPRLQRLPMRWR